MTNDEEADEIVRRLKTHPKRRGSEDDIFYYAPYIPIMVVGTKVDPVTLEKITIITRYDKKEKE